MKLVVFADLHLDAPFRWAGPSAGRGRRKLLEQVLARIVELAREERADAILCAGDLYEHDRFTPDTIEVVRQAFAKAEPIRVLVAPGNHDWYGAQALYRQAAFGCNVHVFREDRFVPVALADGLTLWGAAHLRPAGTRGFLDAFRVDRGGVNLALFHGSEEAGFAMQGSEKVAHAPFRTEQIREAGFHHAFVGHYHQPADAGSHTYPGNPDPLEFGEEGERGVVVATIAAAGGLDRRRVRVALSQAHDVRVNVTGCASGNELRQRVVAALEGLAGAARVTLFGELAREIDFRPDDVEPPDSIDALQVRIAPEFRVAYDLEVIALESTVRGQFVREVLEDGALEMEERRAVIVTGLRALEGRADLEVF